MLKLTKDPQVTPIQADIDMCDMAPLDVGRITDCETNHYSGHIVLRTANRERFEVMDLTQPGPGMCWDDSNGTMKVRLLEPGEAIAIKLFNADVER